MNTDAPSSIFSTYVCVSLGTRLPGCFCIRPVFISLNPLGPQQTSAVCSLVIEELNSRFLYPEEPPSKSVARYVCITYLPDLKYLEIWDANFARTLNKSPWVSVFLVLCYLLMTRCSFSCASNVLVILIMGTVNSWIGQRLYFGRLTPTRLLSLFDFRTKTSFEFFIKNYTRQVFPIFRKIKNELARTICVFLAILVKNQWFSDNRDTLAIKSSTSVNQCAPTS